MSILTAWTCCFLSCSSPFISLNTASSASKASFALPSSSSAAFSAPCASAIFSSRSLLRACAPDASLDSAISLSAISISCLSCLRSPSSSLNSSRSLSCLASLWVSSFRLSLVVRTVCLRSSSLPVSSSTAFTLLSLLSSRPSLSLAAASSFSPHLFSAAGAFTSSLWFRTSSLSPISYTSFHASTFSQWDSSWTCCSIDFACSSCFLALLYSANVLSTSFCFDCSMSPIFSVASEVPLRLPFTWSSSVAAKKSLYLDASLVSLERNVLATSCVVTTAGFPTMRFRWSKIRFSSHIVDPTFLPVESLITTEPLPLVSILRSTVILSPKTSGL